MFPRAKKRFGQHFLVDRNIIGKIVRLAGVEEGELVLEIGPGTGLLTGALLDAGARVVAVELDRTLIEGLVGRFSGTGRFDVIEADSLGVSFPGLSERFGGRFKCVSNLPYNISGPITAKFVDERGAFTSLVLMYQKEVAERLTAVPGTKDYGALSVMVQTFMDVRAGFDVSPGCFRPPPKVTSTVVSLRVLAAPSFEVVDEAFFRRVVRAAFASRRKTLLNNLRPFCGDRDELGRAVRGAGLDPGRRAETLHPSKFGLLAKALAELRKRN